MTSEVFIRFRRELESAAEPDYAVFSRSLTPTQYPILGVRIPYLRKKTLHLFRQGIRSIPLRSDSSHEEILAAGILLARSDFPLSELFPLIEDYLSLVDNWAACDTFCSELKRAREMPEPFRELIRPLFRDSREFYVRFAEVLLLNAFVRDEYIAENLELLASVTHPGYYACMGAAWALSVCYVDYPDETEKLLLSSRLRPEIRKRTVRKIKESNRVTLEQKERIQLLTADLE